MMIKRIKKIVVSVFVVALLMMCFALVACGGKDGQEQKETSELIGGFESSGSELVCLTNDESKLGSEKFDNDSKSYCRYIYTSDIYPLDTVDDVTVNYITYQKLRLKRDFSYEYNVEITLRKITDNGNTDLAKLEATTKGTFDFAKYTGENYGVTISNPTEGTESRYGAYITGEGNIFSWKMSTAPDYSLDIKSESAKEEPQFDRYVNGKYLAVEKSGAERILYNDVFFDDLLVDIAPYCSFDSGSAEIPVPEPPTPPAPEPEEEIETVMPADKHGDVSVALCLDDGGMAIHVTAPKATESVTFGTETVTEYKTVGDERLFDFPVTYSSFTTSVNVKAGEQDFNFKISDYLSDLTAVAADAKVEDMSASRLAAGLLNAAKLYGAPSIVLPSGADAFLVDAGESKWNSDWTSRDSMLARATGSDAAGFAWTGNGTHTVPALTVNAQGVPSLNFDFSTFVGMNSTLIAEITVGDKTETRAVTPQSVGAVAAEYSVGVVLDSPLVYADDVMVQIFDGNDPISRKVVYSGTRAFAYLHSYKEQERPIATAMYSLAKYSAWFESSDDLSIYSEDVNKFGTGKKRYEFTVSEFSYAVDGNEDKPGNYWGTTLYVGDQLIHDNADTYDDEFFAAKKDGNAFNVTLKGGAVKGMFTLQGAPDGITVTVAGNSSLYYNILTSKNNGGTPTKAAAINADHSGATSMSCPVVIIGDGGKHTLDVMGGIYVPGDLTVSDVTLNVYGSVVVGGKLTVTGGATVNVISQSADGYDGVTVTGDLDVQEDGKLDVRYAGKTACSKSGICVSEGNVTVEGILNSTGFRYGLFLNSTGVQTLTVQSGELNITAELFGINSNSAISSNRTLTFNGGVSVIHVTGGSRESGGGIALADITVGEGELYVTSDNSRPLCADKPVTVRTTSGDKDKGKLSLVNHATDEFFDQIYAMRISLLDLNGGSVYCFANLGNGVITTESNAVINVQNADLHIESGVFGHGIAAQSNHARINVTNSGKLMFTNCRAAVACYGASYAHPSEEEAAHVVNEGLIVMDVYGAHSAGGGLPSGVGAGGEEWWAFGTDDVYVMYSGSGVVRRGAIK